MLTVDLHGLDDPPKGSGSQRYRFGERMADLGWEKMDHVSTTWRKGFADATHIGDEHRDAVARAATHAGISSYGLAFTVGLMEPTSESYRV